MKKILFILLFSVLYGCSDDFIEANPKDALASGNFWQTINDANLALTGVYDALQYDNLYALRNQNHGSLREQETFTDNSINGFFYQNYNNIKTGALNPGVNHPVERPWTSLYRVVGRANQVIVNTQLMENVSEEEKNLILAQAKAIRALAYWNLTYAWDDVPLITKLLGPQEQEVPKNTALEIYDQIVKDLEEAAEVLPENWNGSDYGRITSGGANGLLARVHLFFYGYHNVANGAEKAAEATAKIINSGRYSLFPDYSSLFTPENEDSEEIIWSVRFSEELGGNNQEGFSSSKDIQAQQNNQPLPNLSRAFYMVDGLPINESPLYDPEEFWKNRDPRWDATLIYNGEKWLENQPPFNLIGGLKRTGFNIDKYVTSNNALVPEGAGGQDWYILRYADVLLMRAEALLEMGNSGQEVYDLINTVRQRVGMPTIEEVEGTGLSIVQLTDILRHERRVELAFENTRFPDLKRWGTVEEAYIRSADDVKPGGNALILSGVQYQGDRSIILPIPQVEIDVNPALEQHPAW